MLPEGKCGSKLVLSEGQMLTELDLELFVSKTAIFIKNQSQPFRWYGKWYNFEEIY